MYQFNTKPENWDIKDYTPGTRHKNDTEEKQWGHSRSRRLLNLAYTLAFTCLLRFDEVLKIQAHDITIFQKTHNTDVRLEVRLPFRKTSQFGGVCVIYATHCISSFCLHC
jgi:hypothetical protein